ncbi:MAG: arsenic resistance N-acetyltransferase ArsN2 [Gammaproteobacteria bacterium]|nr:arsenic resistance N-acetyltransferase ArsN2 [Gammaproteobacteria bacterium]
MTWAVVDLNVQYLAQVQSLLKANGLPFEDCARHIDNFGGVFEKSQLIACGGLEILGREGLLRSVVVRGGFKGRGLAGLVVEYLHEKARMNRLQELFLLTESAQGYFEGLGYQSISRDDLPGEVKTTQQYLCLCPASAQAMHFILADQP